MIYLQKHPVTVVYSLLALLLWTGCTEKPDFEAEKQAILAVQERQRQAHFEKNVALLLEDGAPDYLEVNRGKIRQPSREESMQRFQAYFDAVEFVHWDDATPPRISFSDDANMATVVVDKFVVTRQLQENNRLDTAYFAWLAVYKKMDGRWKLHRMGSTSR